MALGTFDELKTAIANHADRADLTTFLDDFVVLAETLVNYGSDKTPALRVRDMTTQATLVATSTGWTLPTDFLSYSHARLGNCNLTYLDKEAFEDLATSGTPEFFTIIGNELRANGSTSGDLVLTYFQAIPALSDSNTTNWLLTKHPNIYLKLCLFELALFTKDEGEATRNAGLASAYITGLNNANELAEYSGASMSISDYAQ